MSRSSTVDRSKQERPARRNERPAPLLAMNADAQAAEFAPGEANVIMSSSFERRSIGRVFGCFSCSERPEMNGAIATEHMLYCVVRAVRHPEQNSKQETQKTLKEH